jgi:hypothetical protein
MRIVKQLIAIPGFFALETCRSASSVVQPASRACRRGRARAEAGKAGETRESRQNSP